MSYNGVFKQKNPAKPLAFCLLSLAISHINHRKSNEFFNTSFDWR